jgi:uncharacterized membrane protein HdeD (DUF308 family)
MNLPDPQFTKNFRSLPDLRDRWMWYCALGVAFIILGILAIGASTMVTLASVVFLGSLLLIGGILQIGYTFGIRQWSGFFLSLLAGILYSVVGFLMIAHPAISAVSLTLLIAVLFLVGGIFRIVSAAATRFEHWGWAVFSGVVKCVLGLLIWLGWPATGLWVIGLFIGIDLIFFGWFWVLISLTARSVVGKR